MTTQLIHSFPISYGLLSEMKYILIRWIIKEFIPLLTSEPFYISSICKLKC